MRLRGWKLGLTLGCALLGIQTLQSVVETIVFNTDIGMSAAELSAVVASALMRCLIAAFAVALLWRGESQPATEPSGLTWKSPAIALVYVILYFSAGSLIAWRSAAVRTYYAHIGQLDPRLLVAIQFARGLIWCALAWLLWRALSGPSGRVAILVGLAFSGFMIPSLLFPNPFMPWPVRAVHMIEVGTSNFLFGVLAVLVFCLRANRRPLGEVR
jgi:hypothetical protein